MLRNALRTVLIPLLSLLATTSALHAAQAALPPSPFEAPPFTLTAAAIRAASAAMPSERVSDATILHEESTYRFDAAGALTYTHRMVFRIETQKAVEGWSEASIDWDPWYQNSAQIHARILQPDDTFAELDQKTITDAPLNTNTDDGTYTSEHVRKAPLPGLAIGAIVEQVESVEDKKPYFNGGLVYRYFFANNAPTERERVVVELPAATPLQDRVSNIPDLTITRSEAAGLRRVVYERGPRPATVYGDIDLESATAPFPTLEFSTGSSWANVVKRYAELSDPRILTDQVADLLPSDTSNRLATIQQLVQRLHKEVRYTGVEFNEAQLTPQPPSEVLKRHYGDCKDKATLLVAMLRAAHIPANLALLSAGNGRDVNPDLPGMNRFNHAIVYVPAGKDPRKDPALWIDATAEFSQVGTLPFGDPGRLALIIDPATTALTRIPPPQPEDSILTETRTFTLAQLGPSQVVETSDTHGYVDATYRALYGGPTTKKTQEDLDNYARNAYLAKGLTRFDHGDGADLSHPFQLKLMIDGARRGSTGLGDAGVAIFPTSPLNELPAWFKTPAPTLPDDATAEQKADRAAAAQQRSPTYVIRPFIVEQRYRILVPAGFSLRALPEDRTTPLGPASLSEHYALESPSVFTATLRFTTGKSTLTTQEALDLRDAVVQFQHRDAILVGFEQTGIKLLAAGKIKEALAVDQDAVNKDPQSALPHVRLARALLQAGVGDMARKEAAAAVALEPTSPAALTTQGWVLEHDLLGVRFGLGYDRAGAIAAFQAALAVKNDDFDPRFDLAIQYEFDAHGARYASNDLPEAIALYRSLIADGLKKNTDVTDYRNSLAYALLFHHDFKDLEALQHDLPGGINRSVVAIVAATAQKDAAAGLAAATNLNISADERNQALVSAGAYLAQMGLYPDAAAILSAGIQGGKDAPMIARQIELYKNLHRVPLASPPITTPESAAFAMYNLGISGSSDRDAYAKLISHHAYLSEAAFQRNLDHALANAGQLHVAAANSGVAETVLRDIILGSMTLKASGDDAHGYRILSQSPGSEAEHMFLVREDGSFRIVADDHDVFEVGAFALWALDHNQPALAKSILDWRRELLHKGGGDDPYSGPLLPRYWTVDSPKPGADSPENMRIAALAMLAGSMEVAPYLDFVAAQRDKATGVRQADLTLLLAELYTGVEQPKPAIPLINQLLADEPDSITLINLAGAAYALANDTAAWKALLAPRLARKPTDPDLLRAQTQLLATAHDFAAARASEKTVFDSGKANSNDYNSYAWLALFDNHLTQDVTEATQQSNMLSKNSSFADLHTEACIYAAQGKVTEAQQVLTQSMTAGNLAQPNSAIWYALGLLYEDYGLPAAALAAYNEVEAHEFDDHHFIDAESTYTLAQTRIHALSQK